MSRRHAARGKKTFAREDAITKMTNVPLDIAIRLVEHKLCAPSGKKAVCFRNNCRFRHPKIVTKLSMIQCMYETKPGGCRKSDCACRHLKNRTNLQNIKPTPSLNSDLQGIKITVGKIYCALLILDNWRTTRFRKMNTGPRIQ
ncbi:hypothetical protein NPIL_482521, partial [Nephila pilipes]